MPSLPRRAYRDRNHISECYGVQLPSGGPNAIPIKRFGESEEELWLKRLGTRYLLELLDW